jgi:hypothetical protein
MIANADLAARAEALTESAAPRTPEYRAAAASVTRARPTSPVTTRTRPPSPAGRGRELKARAGMAA